MYPELSEALDALATALHAIANEGTTTMAVRLQLKRLDNAMAILNARTGRDQPGRAQGQDTG